MFTITNSSQTKTLEAWGLSDLALRRTNAGVDALTLIADGRAVDAAEIFPFDSTVIVNKGSARWFYGIVDESSRIGTAAHDGHVTDVLNPWLWLTEKNFRQLYRTPTAFENGVPTAFDEFYHPVVQLFRTINFDPTSPAEQIIEVLQFLIAAGAPIAIGTIDGGEPRPVRDVYRSITCEEVLRACWLYVPDGIFFWDYSTEPYPTLHFRRAQNLDAVDVALREGTSLTSLRIRERNSWARPYVKITYQALAEAVDGQAYETPYLDLHPPTATGNELRGLDLHFDLPLQQSQTTLASITTEAADYATVAWWQRREICNELVDAAANSVVLIPGTAAIEGTEFAYNENLTRRLVRGTFQEWMGGAAQSVRVSADFSFTKANGTKVARKKLSFQFVATDLVTGTYPNTQIGQYAETPPVGIAEYLYNAYRKLTAEGSLSTVHAELPSTLVVGKRLNIVTPNRPAWATLNALIQESEESAFNGVTSITFGAPAHFSANDLLDLCRQARQRRAEGSFSIRSTGANVGPARVQMPSYTADKAHDNAEAVHEKVVIGEAEVPGVGKGVIIFDTNPAPATAPAAVPARAVDFSMIRWKAPDGNYYPVYPQFEGVSHDGVCGTHGRMFLCSEKFAHPH